MPYQVFKENVDVVCSSFLCENNEDGKCKYDCDVDDVYPSKEDWCEHFEYKILIDKGYTFKNEKEMRSYLEEDAAEGIPVVSFDPECLRLVYKKVKSPKGFIREAYVQISEEDEKCFNYRPCVDGGIILVAKAQTDLFEPLEVDSKKVY